MNLRFINYSFRGNSLFTYVSSGVKLRTLTWAYPLIVRGFIAEETHMYQLNPALASDRSRRDLLPEMRPREKLESEGLNRLKEWELLSLILGRGKPTRLVATC